MRTAGSPLVGAGQTCEHGGAIPCPTHSMAGIVEPPLFLHGGAASLRHRQGLKGFLKLISWRRIAPERRPECCVRHCAIPLSCPLNFGSPSRPSSMGLRAARSVGTAARHFEPDERTARTATDDDDSVHHGGACDGRDDRGMDAMDAGGADVAKLAATADCRPTDHIGGHQLDRRA